MPLGRLFIVSGPSGAGKGTLVRHLLERVPDVWCSISATTRSPREGEEHGRHYFFLSDQEFDSLVESDGFIEWANVHGRRYGTLRTEVEAHMARGESVILEIDPQGAMQVKRNRPDAILIFVMPPTMEELRCRLVRRGTETDHQIEGRLRAAKGEVETVPHYDFVIVNDELEVAIGELVDCVVGRTDDVEDCR